MNIRCRKTVIVLCSLAIQLAPAGAQQASVEKEKGSTYQLPARTASKAPFKWPAPTASDLVVTTAGSVEGFKVVAYRGLVEGVAVREPSGTQDLAAQLQGMFGAGSIDAYGQMCEQGRVQAYNNLMQRARGMGANAVVGVRFDNENLFIDREHSATAVVCYGTAVVIEPVGQANPR
jgi:uncharacterized protein YbjQ (UPF0145 family)